MAQLLVRDVPVTLVDALKRRAAAHGLSAEAEHRDILKRALEDNDDFWVAADRLRAETQGRSMTDSADLIRESRDSR